MRVQLGTLQQHANSMTLSSRLEWRLRNFLVQENVKVG
jgi:hypothetical protein